MLGNVAYWDNGMHIVDMADPAQPVQIDPSTTRARRATAESTSTV